MGKNIKVRQSDSSELKLDNIVKIRTELQGGGTCDWVPEDGLQLITKRVTENGTYTAANDNAYGYSAVTVEVPNGVSGTVNITQNGTANVGVYARANVQVPNTYAAGDEGKVVSSGALVMQTARASQITANGTYDTTNNNSVTVNLSWGVEGATFGKLRVGPSTPLIPFDGVEYGPMNNRASDYITPMLDNGEPAKLDLSQPFEICCRFKIGTSPTSDGRNIWGSLNSYYHCPAMAVYPDKITYFVSTSGDAWQYRSIAITPSNYTLPLNTYITARMTWDGTDFTFYANDGTNEYTATRAGVTPYYNPNYSFEFGGAYASVYSIANCNATIDLSQTYLKQGSTMLWKGFASA